MLSLDVAIVTRNRARVLDLSLPLLLGQSRRPNSILIVDSSDDPEPVARVVGTHAATTEIPITLIRSPAGMTVQRNIALQHVGSEIVMFPDDDSLLLPGALEAIMRIYEADDEERIGGVCGREVLEAPADMLSVARKSYEMTRLDRVKQKVARQRFLLERRFCPDPLTVHGRSRCEVHGTPAWLAGHNAVPVEFMAGFRMSFRTRLIAAHRFDETLGRYALFEDVDASFSILKTHLIAAAWDAGIFHYRSPERRDAGRMLGVMQILNRAYVICKHAAPESAARRSLKTYALYKIGIYLSDASSPFGRERLAGAVRAYRCLPRLLQAAPAELTATYLRLRAECLDAQRLDDSTAPAQPPAG